MPLRPGTRNEAIDRLNEIFVVLATSTIRGLPTEVELGPDDGIPRRCVLNADHTATIAKEHLGELITTLGLRATCRGLPGTGPRDGLLSRFVVLRWGCERDVAAQTLASGLSRGARSEPRRAREGRYQDAISP